MRTGVKWCVVVAAGLFMGACKDSGLPGKNLPLEQSMNSAWRYPLYETTPASARVIPFDGHVWQITGESRAVPANMLQSVASVNGADLFALKSDPAPYVNLYSGSAGNYHVVARVY